MRTMKKVLTLMSIMIFIMLSTTGCMSRRERLDKAMLEHMYEKYGVEFEIDSFAGRGIDCSYDTWYCYAKGDDPDTDMIQVHRWYSGKDTEYHDEYFSRMIREELESRAHKALENFESEYKMYMSQFEYADDKYTELEQLEEFEKELRVGHRSVMMFFILDQQEEGRSHETVLAELQEALRNADMEDRWMRIQFVKNEELMREINKKTYEDMMYWEEEKKIYTTQYSGYVFGELKKIKF